MIAFIIDPKIMRWMTEYVENVRWYFKERFDLDTNLIFWGNPAAITKDYDVLIFIQKVSPNMLYGHIPSQNGHRRRDQVVPPVDKHKTRRVFLLNTEQATLTNTMNTIIQSIKQYGLHVIDYSPANIEILRPQLPGHHFIHLPFPFRPKPTVPKTIPLISLVTPGSSHRRSTIASINQPVRNFYNLWSNIRDAEIARSKILINVHFNPTSYRIFESIRCYNALEYRTLVVSETGIHDDKILLHDYIIFASAEQLPAKVADVLANYDNYYAKMFNPQRIAEIEERFATCYRKAIDDIYAVECNY